MKDSILNSIKQFPACTFLQGNNCNWITNKVGRLYPTSKAFCNIKCKKNGPYCGQQITLNQERDFLKRGVDIIIPEIFGVIKQDLNFLKSISSFKTILLTGSMIVKYPISPIKDYDIILWFSSLNDKIKTELYDKLPKQINNVNIDYFFQVGINNDIPDLHFACIDPENRIFYTSRWFKMNVLSIENDIKIIDRYNEYFDNILQEVIAESEVKPKNKSEPISQKNQFINDKNVAKSTWKHVKGSWNKAISFSKSIISRDVGLIGLFDKNSSEGLHINEEDLHLRKLSCFGDGKTLTPCSVLEIKETHSYCGACGCGQMELARLSSLNEEYTKLHYPYLECPLKRRGFSNHPKTAPLSILIPCLNDNEEINLTIKSIRDTAPGEVEVIVVDDRSDIPVTLTDSQVILIRNEIRIGAGASRHLAATKASSDLILLLDSHMRFVPGWYEAALKRLELSKNTIWCGECLGLNQTNMDVNKPIGVYTGAHLVIYDGKQVFEGMWQRDMPGDDYEISCLMGACYFMHKEWFLYLKGLEGNKLWGSEEPFLSLKCWLAGGKVKLMKDVKIGHKFRNTAPYNTDTRYPLYNKLRAIKTLLPTELYQFLLNKMPDDFIKIQTLELIEQDKNEIINEQEYYKTIFKHDINWFCDRFSIDISGYRDCKPLPSS